MYFRAPQLTLFCDLMTRCTVRPFVILCWSKVSGSLRILPAKIRHNCSSLASNCSATNALNYNNRIPQKLSVYWFQINEASNQVNFRRKPGYLDPISISDKTSYRKISWSLETSRLVVYIVSLRNLTGTLAELLWRCLSHFRVIGQSLIQISWLLRLAALRSYNKTSYRILKQGPGTVCQEIIQWLLTVKWYYDRKKIDCHEIIRPSSANGSILWFRKPEHLIFQVIIWQVTSRFIIMTAKIQYTMVSQNYHTIFASLAYLFMSHFIPFLAWMLKDIFAIDQPHFRGRGAAR